MAEPWKSPPPEWLDEWCIWRFRGQVGARPQIGKLEPWHWNYLQWAGWKRRGPAPRPDFPKDIPSWAWVILAQINRAVPKPPVVAPVPKPPPPMVNKSWLTTRSSVDFTHPGGETENAAAMLTAGFEYGVLNVMDGATWEDWASTRKALDTVGVAYGVGGRPYNRNEVAWQLDYAIQVGADFAVLNIENEFQSTLTPPVVAETILASRYSGTIMIDTPGWLYNDVNYTPVAHYPVMLQVYQEDMRLDPADLPRVVNDCIIHAREKGFTDIAVQFQSYRADPSMYDFWGSKPRNFFTGNVCGADGWKKWAVPK